MHEPEKLLDYLYERFNVTTDVALAKALNVGSASISRIRSFRRKLGPALLIRIHERTGVPTRELRAIMGDTREDFDL